MGEEIGIRVGRNLLLHSRRSWVRSSVENPSFRITESPFQTQIRSLPNFSPFLLFRGEQF